MKEKITIFIIGLLLGSVISTASIYVYTIANNGKNDVNMDFRDDRKQGENDATPPEMPKKEISS